MYPPPPPFLAQQQKTDRDQIRLLAIFHFITGGLAIFAIGFLILHYLIMSRVFVSGMHGPHGPQMPPEVFKLMTGFYWIGGLLFAAGGIANILSGFFLLQRKYRTFSFVIAGLNCLQVPLGTLLGVFTILVLSRESVRASYESQIRTTPAP